MTLKEIVSSIEIWNEWLYKYQEFVPKFINEAKLGKAWKEWDNDTFYEFFERSADQCVSSLKQGYFTNEEKSKIKENWNELAPLLKELADNQTIPNWECYTKIKEIIRKYTSQDRRASTNRIIASLQPRLLCTVVSEKYLYELFVNLKKNVSDNIPKYIGGDWFSNSHAILKLFKNLLPDANYMDIVTYPWQVREFFLKTNKQNRDMSYPIDEMTDILLSRKQIILQGSPGTGKTYKTAELAVSICNPDFEEFGNREAIMTEYNKLKSEGQICFTTFHQSMDYEEFVEGLKPISGVDGIFFESKSGLFKKVCDRALLDEISLSKSISTELEFDEIYDTMLNNPTKLKTKNGSEIEFKSNNNENLNFRYINSNNNAWSRNIVSKERLKQLYEKFDTADEINRMTDISSSIRAVIKGCDTSAYWAVLWYIIQQKGIVQEEQIDIENFSDKEKESVIQAYLKIPQRNRNSNNNRKKFVLIIDEINRGSISKILGELITLLEADKRIGEPNELTATLPYSQREFGVPSNLHIIGTMNTADRSVGYIDYAIRRRFAFLTIKSDFGCIRNTFTDTVLLKIAENLYESVAKLINENISREFSVDDLMIGHSYFMASTLEELEMKLIYEIKPLLREYANDGILYLSKNDKGKYDCIEILSANSNRTLVPNE